MLVFVCNLEITIGDFKNHSKRKNNIISQISLIQDIFHCNFLLSKSSLVKLCNSLSILSKYFFKNSIDSLYFNVSIVYLLNFSPENVIICSKTLYKNLSIS